MFIEPLLCARHCSKCTSMNRAEVSVLVVLLFWWEAVLQRVLEGGKCNEEKNRARKKEAQELGRCLQF